MVRLAFKPIEVMCSLPSSEVLLWLPFSFHVPSNFRTDTAGFIAECLSMHIAVVVLFYSYSLYLYGTQTQINHATMPGDLHFPSPIPIPKKEHRYAKRITQYPEAIIKLHISLYYRSLRFSKRSYHAPPHPRTANPQPYYLTHGVHTTPPPLKIPNHGAHTFSPSTPTQTTPRSC